ncbi:Putative phage tail protein [Balnearium lithotrophicum]|uniref:Phage tail protein n=1 Tax=Balnearium lithotrophicum TaxID=223788 RepID=A0A521CRL8_9BACT|nr:phage tail protein [Balnearium lithotrophicum]SMO62025.1 Putative phage tail protein [Balnearium lithotrophicum]
MGFFHKIGHFFSSTLGSALLLGASFIPFFTPISTIWKIAIVATAFAGSYAAAKYQQSLLKRSFGKISAGGYLANTRSTQSQIPVVYGRCRVGINWIWAATSGNNNEYLYIVGTLSEGPIEKVEEIWLDGKPLVGVKEIEKSESKVVKKITNQRINKVKLTVSYPKLLLSSRADTLEIARGETVDKGSYTVSFSNDGTVTVEGKVIDNVCVKWSYEWDDYTSLTKVCKESKPVYQRINSVTFNEFSTDGGNTWFKSPNDLVEWDYVVGGEDNFNSKFGGLFDEVKNLGFTDNVPYTACLIVRLKWATVKSGNVIQPRWSGVPNITAVVNGRTVDNKGTGFNKDNPALILLDYLTNTRYGLGIPEEKIDIESFLEVAQYCDEQGFSFNGVIYDSSAKDVVELLCNHFRGILIKSGGKYKLKYKNLYFESPVMKFDEADYIEGSFSYDLPSRTRIPNSIKVEYIDPVMNDTPNTLTLEVQDDVTVEENPIDIKLYGVDRLGAKRLGAYFLERARLNHTVTFTTTTKALPLEPGDIISVTYKDFGIENQLFRVEEIRQVDDDTVSVVAVIEDYKLYNEDIDLEIRNVDVTDLPSPNDPPLPVVPSVLESTELDKDGTPMSYVVVSWPLTEGYIDHYEVWVNESGTWELAGITKAPPYKVLVKAGETYKVKVIPVTIFGIKADWEESPEVSISVAGITEGPVFSGGLSTSIDNTKKLLTATWSRVTDKDFDHFTVTVYKKDTNEILDQYFTSTNKITIPLNYESDITIGVKAVNTSGVASEEFRETIIRNPLFPLIVGHLSCAGNVLIINPWKPLNGNLTIKTPIFLVRDFFSKGFAGLRSGNLTTDQLTGLGFYFDNVVPYNDSQKTCHIYKFSLTGDLSLIDTIELPEAKAHPFYRTDTSPLYVAAWLDVFDSNFYVAYLENKDNPTYLKILKNGSDWKTLDISSETANVYGFNCRVFVFENEEFIAAYDYEDSDLNWHWKVYSSRTNSWISTEKLASSGNIFPQKMNDGIFYITNDSSLSPAEQYRKIDLNLNNTFLANADHFRAYNPYERNWYIGYVDDYLYRLTQDGKTETWWYAVWNKA